MSSFFEIDGGVMEGGGQVLRISLALSALFKKPISIRNIRAGRSTPGLRPQHLAGVRLMRDITGGELTGDEIGSTRITFKPGPIVAGKYNADAKTAGSVTLLFQVAFPCLLFADSPSNLCLRGGTNVDMAPQIDDVLQVFLPVANRMGAQFTCGITKRGFFPKGGGEIRMRVFPVRESLRPIEMLDAGNLEKVEGEAFVAGFGHCEQAEEMSQVASRFLCSKQVMAPTITVIPKDHLKAVGNGSGLILVAKTSTGCLLGGSGLTSRNCSIDKAGLKAAEEIYESIRNNSCIDQHVQDQLVIFMALAAGKSRLKIGPPTLHTKTAIHIVELMTSAKFAYVSENEKGCILECEGIGMKRQRT